MITVHGRCGKFTVGWGGWSPLFCWRMRMPLGIVPGGEAPHIRGTGECGGISCHVGSLSGCSSYRPGCQVLAESELGPVQLVLAWGT